MATEDPLHACVRFYLSTLDALDASRDALARCEAATREAIAPYSDALGAAGDPWGLSRSVARGSADLWRPQDPVALRGLTDVYEVRGRFTFEGEDGANLAALSESVRASRREVDRQRAALVALTEVPARAREKAAERERAEAADTQAQQAKALGRFEPEAAQLREICQKLLDAVRAQKRPDLADVAQAPTLYADYVSRVSGLYAKALPYLRGALADLSRAAGVEAPPSWPDALPFSPSLPEELVSGPPPESAAEAEARRAAEHADAQRDALARAQDELGVQLRRLEGEATALAQRDLVLQGEVETARAVARWAAQRELVDAARAAVAAVTEEGTRRTHEVEKLLAEGNRAQQTLASIQAEATQRAQAAAALEQSLAKHREDEPALFGKDDWRRRGETLEAELDEARSELARRQQLLQAANAEVARVAARRQSESTQIAQLARQLDEARAREAAAERDAQRMEQSLGAHLPPRRMSTAEAEQGLAAASAALQELRARVERLHGEQRRVREDLDRAAVQIKQAAGDGEKHQRGLAEAARHAAAAREQSLRALAARRQAAFESHVDSVLSGLEESLTQVDRVFIEPARRALLAREGVTTAGPEALRASADGLAAALPAVLDGARAALDAESARLDAVERGFVAEAPRALPAAWG
ncbi:MAG: hypothetical protein R3A52_11720 [Polyangiales bacterium]